MEHPVVDDRWWWPVHGRELDTAITVKSESQRGCGLTREAIIFFFYGDPLHAKLFQINGSTCRTSAPLAYHLRRILHSGSSASHSGQIQLPIISTTKPQNANWSNYFAARLRTLSLSLSKRNIHLFLNQLITNWIQRWALCSNSLTITTAIF